MLMLETRGQLISILEEKNLEEVLRLWLESEDFETKLPSSQEEE